MAAQSAAVIDLVLQIETVTHRGKSVWRVQSGAAREFIPPLTDDDLRKVSEEAISAGQPPMLPPFASTWDGLLAHLGPNERWRPDARVLERIGRLIHEHVIRGKIAEHVARIEANARTRRIPLRYVVHVFEGEEDSLLRRLPFELLHHGSFWFRRANTVGVRLPPVSEACDVHLVPGASVLIAAAHADDREPSAAQLEAHVDAIARLALRAGFTARPLPGCTPAALEAALQQGCDVLYLVCHGEEDLDRHGRLALRGGDTTGRQLGEWLEAADAAGHRTQAAILCACSSAVPGRRPGTMGMAEHLAATGRRAAAALGFRAPVQVAWALAFMTEVFEQLADGKSLEVAVASARRKQPEHDSQWSLPLMFAHERDPFGLAQGATGRDFDLTEIQTPCATSHPRDLAGRRVAKVARAFEPLEPASALALLEQLAREGEPFPPDEAAAARDLVHALDGLALAIELAGAQLRRGASLDEIRLAALSDAADADIPGRVARLVERSLAELEPGDEPAWTLIAAAPPSGVTERELALGLEEPEGRAGRRLFRLRQAGLLHFQIATARYTMRSLACRIAQMRAETSHAWEEACTRAAAVWREADFFRDSELLAAAEDADERGR